MSTGLICLTLRTLQGLVHYFPHILNLKRLKKEKKHALAQLLASQGVILRPLESLNIQESSLVTNGNFKQP